MTIHDLQTWLDRLGPTTDDGQAVTVPIPVLIALYCDLTRYRAEAEAGLRLAVEQLRWADEVNL